MFGAYKWQINSNEYVTKYETIQNSQLTFLAIVKHFWCILSSCQGCDGIKQTGWPLLSLTFSWVSTMFIRENAISHVVNS